MDRLDLDCGIAFGRIVAWLDAELALPRREGTWRFACDRARCDVQLEELEPRAVGPLAFERTRLTAQGDATAVAAFKRVFTLRFMSAGG